MRRRTPPIIAVAGVVAVLTVLLSAPGHASRQPPVDEVEKAWVEHRPVTLYVDVPDGPADGPSDEHADATVYLIAPLDPDNPQDPGANLTLPDGQQIVVPVHDTVLDDARGDPADCFGVQVLPGPHATPETVLTRPDPNGGATLAYAIKLGAFRIALNGERTIKLAQRYGFVTLDETWPGYGGRCWSSEPSGRPVLTP